MNYIKLQQDIIAGKLKDTTRIFWWPLPDDKVAICVDGCAAYCIPKDKLLLDLSKCGKEIEPMRDYCCSFPEDLLKATGKWEQIGRSKAEVFEGKHGDVYVDAKLLKYFDRKTMKLLQSELDRAIHAYEMTASGLVYVGLIAPIKKPKKITKKEI